MWHFDPCSHLATTDMGRKLEGAVPLWGRGAWSPSNTMCLGLRPTCMPSFILISALLKSLTFWRYTNQIIIIHPTVWPQCTNVTDRTTVRWYRANHFRNGRPKKSRRSLLTSSIHFVFSHVMQGYRKSMILQYNTTLLTIIMLKSKSESHNF